MQDAIFAPSIKNMKILNEKQWILIEIFVININAHLTLE